MCASAHGKKDGRNSSRRALSTGHKSYPNPWVACCMKAHSCLREFWRPEYAAYRCLRALPTIFLTPPTQFYTFLLSHSA